MTKKIRVLMLPSDPFGVGHYRAIWPAQEIQKNHSDEFEVDIRLQQPVVDADIGKFDIVHFHRRIHTDDETASWIKRFTDAGAKVIMDVDDYWIPFRGHPARYLVEAKGVHIELLRSIKRAPILTTTTEIYADILREHNPNVHVIPNAVDTELPMWQSKDMSDPDGKVRVGWIGGSSHKLDLARLKNLFVKLYQDSDLKDKFQIVLCGFDTRGTVTEIDPRNGNEKTRKITAEESVWNEFENLFTNDDPKGKMADGTYIRRKTLPITRYGEHYNFVDVCLAPLDQHTFNECKSELKAIETGMHKKVLISSDVYQFNAILEHGKNALLVPPRKDHKLWFKYVKEVILNEDLRKELGQNLYDFVYPAYTLHEVTRQRCEFYKEVLKNV